jgi:hypothetical protein
MSLKYLTEIKKELDSEIHRIRLEKDIYYVLEKMAGKFGIWRPFFYRGHVFLCAKQFHRPDQEDSPPYDFRVRMFVGTRDEAGVAPDEVYMISDEIRISTDVLGKEFEIDFDRCDLEDLIPLINYLMEYHPMLPDEYGWETPPRYTYMDDVYKIIDTKPIPKDIHKSRLETDVGYVLEKMTEKFEVWRPFFYRGHVFLCGRMFPRVQCMEIFVGTREEAGVSPNKPYVIRKEIRSSTKVWEKGFGIEFERCYRSDLFPLIEYLIDNHPMLPDEYE